MLGTAQFRELLIADVALVMGVAQARDVAAALQRYWDDREKGNASLASELQRIAGLAPEALAPVLAEVDRLVAEASGDARLALTRRGGLERSIHVALSQCGARLSSALTEVGAGARTPLRPLPGDRYVDFVPAGEGGMGLVYMALDTELNRLVAFKMVRPDVGSGKHGDTPTTPINLKTPERDTPASRAFEELKARFLQEAWVTGGLEHPGVVPVYELGQTSAGIPYYTMRFVRGQRTFKDALDEVRDAPVEDRLKLIEPFLKLCDTVRYAHSRGVIHRDLKPENVALGEFGEVVLLDWGLAKLEGNEDIAASRWQERVEEFREAADLQTVAGALGTPGYMAPEAAMGQIEQVDAKSDVYSLGVMLFEILTGRLPFEFKSYAEYLDCMARKEAPEAEDLVPDVPETLSELCERCLSRDRTKRPKDVGALSQELRTWQTASALEREVEGLMRDARGAMEAAQGAEGDERLRQVLRAGAALSQVRAKKPDHPALESLTQENEALGERGVREREKATGLRVLKRVGVAALGVAVVAALVFASVLDSRRKETERERDQKAAALAEVLRLADVKKVRDLEDEAAALKPLQVDLLQAVEDWRSRAAALAERSAEHEAALARLREQAQAQGPPWTFEDEALTWQHEVLADLVQRLDALGDPAGDLPRRVARLQRSAEVVSHPAWSAAIERIVSNPAYAGLKIKPQVGLMPLGPDPDSGLGLELFAHVLSGSVPARNGETGRLAYQEDAAIVLVLIPAGTFWMGAQKEDPEKPNHYPGAWSSESPVHKVMLSAYFIAKHECTQAQWAAITGGSRPSRFHEGDEAPRRPVEQLSALDCDEILPAVGLVLPTEAQWEHACRAGKDTPWWAGSSEEDLARVAWYARNAGVSPHPVGAKAANAFGLHDVHGNVWEWCRDEYRPYGSGPVRDPLKEGLGARVARGGGWDGPARFARSAFRFSLVPGYRVYSLGVRPARFVTTD